MTSKHSDHYDRYGEDGGTAFGKHSTRRPERPPPVDDSVRCVATTLDGTRCRQKGRLKPSGLHLCYKHQTRKGPFNYRDEEIAEVAKEKIKSARGRLDPGRLVDDP